MEGPREDTEKNAEIIQQLLWKKKKKVGESYRFGLGLGGVEFYLTAKATDGHWKF